MARREPDRVVLDAESLRATGDERREQLWCEAVLACLRAKDSADTAVAEADALLWAYDRRRTDRPAFGLPE